MGEDYFCKCCGMEYQDGSPVAYTDGACFSNGQNGAVAGVGVYWSDDHDMNVSKPLAGAPTNQRAEIQAAVEALLLADQYNFPSLVIITDSVYVYKGATEWIYKWIQNGWKNTKHQPVANRDDWIELHELRQDIVVKWKHVYRGTLHGNIQADKLAKQGAEMAKMF